MNFAYSELTDVWFPAFRQSVVDSSLELQRLNRRRLSNEAVMTFMLDRDQNNPIVYHDYLTVPGEDNPPIQQDNPTMQHDSPTMQHGKPSTNQNDPSTQQADTKTPQQEVPKGPYRRRLKNSDERFSEPRDFRLEWFFVASTLDKTLFVIFLTAMVCTVLFTLVIVPYWHRDD